MEDFFNNRNIKIPYNNINGIDALLWINMDRSKDRYDNMMKHLVNVNVPLIRIPGIDGDNLTEYNIIKNKNYNNLTKYELGCLLSHIKTINHIVTLEGNYFLVLEDDIDFNILSLHKESIDDIIKSAPNDFDILKLSSTDIKHDNTERYRLWRNKRNIEFSGSTVAYIITKKAAIEISKHMDINNNIHNTNTILNFADIFIYRLVKTYNYIYSYFLSTCSESIIHPDHLDFQRYSYMNQVNKLFNKII